MLFFHSQTRPVRPARQEVKKMRRGVIFLLAAMITAMFCQVPAVVSADFPTKPLTLHIGFGPGGMTDIVSRILCQEMEKFLGQGPENHCGKQAWGGRLSCS